MDLIARTLDPDTSFNFLQYRYGVWIWGLRSAFETQEMRETEPCSIDYFAVDYSRGIMLMLVGANLFVMSAGLRVGTSTSPLLLQILIAILGIACFLAFSYTIKKDARRYVWISHADTYITIEDFLTSHDKYHREFGRIMAKERRIIQRLTFFLL